MIRSRCRSSGAYDATLHLSDAMILQAELLANVMNVSVANTLLADGFTKKNNPTHHALQALRPSKSS